jgi:hypothetical protein
MNYDDGSSSSFYGVFDETMTSEFFDFDFDGSYDNLDVTTDSTTSADDDSNSEKSEGGLSYHKPWFGTYSHNFTHRKWKARI